MDLKDPWLVAAWPGMGGVAVLALKHLILVLEAREVDSRIGDSHDFDHVHVKGGVMEPMRPMRTSMHVWRDPRGIRDLVLIGADAQPPQTSLWGYSLSVAKEARRLGVKRVITFAALATLNPPEAPSEVFGASAPDDALLAELREAGVKPLDGQPVGGLNGLVVAACGAAGVPGVCLLATMPHFAANMPNPKASLAALEAFSGMSGIDFDVTELRDFVERMGITMAEVQARVESVKADAEANGLAMLTESADDDEDEDEPSPKAGPAASDRLRIERMFADAQDDRDAAVRLKAELDRLGTFKEYEDRFLDLFRRGGA